MELDVNSPQQPHIVIVNESLVNIQTVFETLDQSGFLVSVIDDKAHSLAGFIASQANLPDLILLNRSSCNSRYNKDLAEIYSELEINSLTQTVPIILIDATDSNYQEKPISADCLDYLREPFQVEELLTRINIELELKAAKKTIQGLQEQVYRQTAEMAAINYKLAEITAAKLKAEQALEAERAQSNYYSHHDGLTQLANRKLLMQRMQQTLQRVKTQSHTQFAVLIIDLDRFKVVNDSLGHDAGDHLLITVAQHLKSLVRATDTVARFGGDEFVLLLDPIQQPIDAIRCAERIIQALRSPMYVKDQEIFLTPNIGITIGTSDYDQAADLLRDADIAMCWAKKSGKAHYAIFDREMYTQTLMQHEMERDLRQAIEQQHLYVHFQPTVCLLTNQLIGFEALARWNHPTQGSIPPCDFISLAEETGLIVPLGEWILLTTCRQFMAWQHQITFPKDFRISVNISIKQLQEPHFLKRINRILKQTGFPGRHLRLELTESIFLNTSKSVVDILDKLRKKDIELCIDDFGTGYSSLSYLQNLPIDYLKIDRSFVSSLNEGEENLAIINTILTLAHQSGLGAIAEGVETTQQLESLKNIGCRAAQGYLFAMPLSCELAEDLLRSTFGKVPARSRTKAKATVLPLPSIQSILL